MTNEPLPDNVVELRAHQPTQAEQGREKVYAIAGTGEHKPEGDCFTLRDAERCFGFEIHDKYRDTFALPPFSEEILRQYGTTHSLTFMVPATLYELCIRLEKLMSLEFPDERAWFFKEAEEFAHTECPEIGWHLMPMYTAQELSQFSRGSEYRQEDDPNLRLLDAASLTQFAIIQKFMSVEDPLIGRNKIILTSSRDGSKPPQGIGVINEADGLGVEQLDPDLVENTEWAAVDREEEGIETAYEVKPDLMDQAALW